MRITAQNPISIKPQLADALANVEVGDVVRGKLIEMLGESISIKTASGQMFTAALMKTAAELKPGQIVELSITNVNPDGIFAELKTDSVGVKVTEDAKLQQLLKQMDIKPEESNLQAAKLLLKYNMPVTKENITNLVTTQKSMESLAHADAFKAVALLQSELDINITEVTKLAQAAAKLEPQSQLILKSLQQDGPAPAAAEQPGQASQLTPKQGEVPQAEAGGPKAAMQKLTALLGEAEQAAPKLDKLMDNIVKVFETVSQAKPEQTAYMLSKDIKITPAAVKVIVDNTKGENKLSNQLDGLEKLVEALEKNHADVKELKQELKKLFVKPEQLQDKEHITENFKDIVKLGGKVETLIKEQGLEHKLDTSVLQDIKGNIDFVRSVNTNINYLQIPVQINENKTTAEIYVYNNKNKSKHINPENATILVALDLNKLGHIESLISVVRKNVDITFRVEKEDFKKVISGADQALRHSLEARGYSLNPLKLIDMEEKFNLLELEELTSVDAGQLHVDIKV